MHDLEIGHYYLFIEIDWHESALRLVPDLAYCATAYGPHHVHFEKDMSQRYDKNYLLKAAFLSKVLCTDKAINEKFSHHFKVEKFQGKDDIIRYS